MSNTKQHIAFGYYAQNVLQGFYADSFGSIRSNPKIYTYSEDQVKTILNNVNYRIETAKKEIQPAADLIEKYNSAGGALLRQGMSSTQNQMMDWGEFELRIIPCPAYGPDWEYPKAELEIWKQDLPEPIEIHKFSTK